MAGENQNSQAAAGSTGAANAAGGTNAQGAAGGTGEGSGTNPTFVSQADHDAALRSINANVQRSVGNEVEKRFKDLETKLGDLVKQTVASLAETTKTQSGKKTETDGHTPETDLAFAKLQREHEDLKKLLATESERRQAAEGAKRRSDIRTALQAALGNDCERPDVLCELPDVVQKLDVDKDTGEVFATLPDKFNNPQRVKLDLFAVEYVKGKYPQLFRGTSRGGSAASGDQGSGAKVPIAQVLNEHDASEYVRNRAKYDAMLASGQVAIPSKR